MKKNILLKIVLMFVMLTLILSLVACKKKIDDEPDPIVVETSAIDQLVGIIKGADGLIKTLNGVKADGNLTADVDIEINQVVGAITNAFVLGLKGNINSSSPELAINFKDKDVEKLAIGYKSSKLYIKQPLTSLNKNADGTAATDSDAMFADLTALNPTIADAMYIVMDMLEGIDFKLDLDALGDQIDDLAKGMDLSTLIVFKEVTNGSRLEITKATIDMLKSMVLDSLLKGTVGDVANMLVNEIFKTDEGIDYLLGSDIYVEVYRDSNAVINGIKLGFKASDNSTGDIFINLKKFNNASDNKATIAFGSEYTAKSLDLGLTVGLPQKGITGNLAGIITPNFSTDNKVLASGNLTFTDEKDALKPTYVVPAYFNGTSAYFNTANIYSGLNTISGNANLIAAPESSLYSATIYEKNANGSVKGSQSLVKLINSAVANAKANYIADKGKEEEVSTTPSKGLVQMIYELLGGTLATTTKDNVTTYNAITEVDMLKLLDKKFGDYTRFTIYKSKTVETYDAVIKSVIALFDANKAWIIGTEEQNQAGNYGIMNWSKDNWNGGANLYQAGEKNDLLDVVNVFLCNGKTGTTPIDVTTTTVSEFANYYVGMLYYFTTTDQAYIAKVDAADKNLLIAKNIYQASNKDEAAKTALANAKDAYKLAMEKAMFGEGVKDFTIANDLIRQILGVETQSANVLKTIIDGGVYVGIASVKGQGINGNAFISSDKAAATKYLTIAGKVSLTATAAAANITNLDGAVEIAKDYVLVTGDEIDFDSNEYKKIAKWEDGTKKCNTTTGAYIYEMDGAKFVYNDRNANAEGLIDQLMEIYKAYLVINEQIG